MDSTARHRCLSTVDRLVLERGELDPLEFLLAMGCLDYADYREWRQRRRRELQSALTIPVEEVTAALAHAQAYAAEQHLSIEPCPPTAWDQDQGPLSIGPSKTLVQLCRQRLVRPGDRRQGDLFLDSARTLALEALHRALAEHRFDAARTALERLSELPDTQGLVEDYHCLIRAAGPCSTPPAERLRELEEDLVPLAVRTLGARARDYVAPLWAQLAGRLEGRLFTPGWPNLHASYAHAQAQAWNKVALAIEAELDARAHPLLLVRLAEAYARQSRREDARRLWTRLCWEHPQTAAQTLARAPGDEGIAQRWREFISVDVELPPEDFPAWLLIADLAQRSHVPPALAPDTHTGRAYTAVYQLVSTDGEMTARAALHGLRPDLLKIFLDRRRAAYDAPLDIKGLALSREVLKDRADSA